MLGKMLIHGLMAAALIGSAAAVYAEMRDTSQGPAPQDQGQPPAQVGTTPPNKAQTDNGYLRPTDTRQGKHDADRHDRKHKRKHDHDDD